MKLFSNVFTTNDTLFVDWFQWAETGRHSWINLRKVLNEFKQPPLST